MASVAFYEIRPVVQRAKSWPDPSRQVSVDQSKPVGRVEGTSNLPLDEVSAKIKTVFRNSLHDVWIPYAVRVSKPQRNVQGEDLGMRKPM